jgi:hypothetical protein
MSRSWLSLENKTRGLLIGIAIGDAKGQKPPHTILPQFQNCNKNTKLSKIFTKTKE